MIKSVIVRIVIVIVAIALVVLGLGSFYYRDFVSSSPKTLPGYENIVVSPLPISQFTDNYTAGEGVVLIDLAHRNNFAAEELNVLMLRLVSRDLAVRFLNPGDNLKKALLGEEKTAEVKLEETVPVKKNEEEEKLPSAFIIVSPREEFSKDEKKAIKDFIDNGNKLLLIADPTRRDEMNNISLEFGLIFEPGYLYNQKENEINYQNIFLSEFKDNEITKGLGKIALYTAGSISSADNGIVFTDNNTFSNVIATRDRLSPLVLGQESKVLAVYDLTFMTEPQNGTLDNNRLIANIADWLKSPGEKTKPK
ncbi:MAG: hypothetical protein HYY41_01285 [Chloroflexi bacterium]|nr:hypothetical protein [Chloroflexota bacterium]